MSFSVHVYNNGTKTLVGTYDTVEKMADAVKRNLFDASLIEVNSAPMNPKDFDLASNFPTYGQCIPLRVTEAFIGSWGAENGWKPCPYPKSYTEGLNWASLSSATHIQVELIHFRNGYPQTVKADFALKEFAKNA